MKSSSTNSGGPTPDRDFRHFLQAELGRRCARNPHYSLRAFAQRLGVDHASLSQLLRGKRRLTPATIEKLGARLGLGPQRISFFVAGARLCRVGDRHPANHSEVKQLASDAASIVAEWQHFAILELVRLRDFRPDSRWIARILGLTPDNVNIAVSRLVRLRLLAMTADDRWVDLSGDAVADIDDFHEVTVNRLAEQVRQLWLSAGQRTPHHMRHYTSTTVAVAQSRVVDVLDLIERFRSELAGLLARDEPRDDVYRLDIAFFPLTNLVDKENDDGTTRNAVSGSREEP